MMSNQVMKKYQKAVDVVHSSFQNDLNVTMSIYIERMKNLKTNLLRNLIVSETSVCVNKTTPNSLSVKSCLIQIASDSLNIMQHTTNVEANMIISNNTKLFEQKNADYGSSFEDFELIGIVIRLNDKINRIINLGRKPLDEIKVDEKIEDTINDLYNYCVIGLMYC